MDEITSLETSNMGDHVSEKSVGGDVERNAQSHVRATLIKLTRQFTVGDVKLAKGVTRWQRHLWEICKVAMVETPEDRNVHKSRMG